MTAVYPYATQATGWSSWAESLLTEALRWYTQFRESGFDATTLSWIGSTGPRTGVRVSCHDLSRWIADRRLDDEVLQWTLALMALDWTGIDYRLNTSTNGPLDPAFAVFAYLRNGVRPPIHAVSDSLNDKRGGVALTPEIVSALDLSNACHRIQYIPPAVSPSRSSAANSSAPASQALTMGFPRAIPKRPWRACPSSWVSAA